MMRKKGCKKKRKTWHLFQTSGIDPVGSSSSMGLDSFATMGLNGEFNLKVYMIKDLRIQEI